MTTDTLISTGKITFTTNYSNCASKSGTNNALTPKLLTNWWTVTGVAATPASGAGLSAAFKPTNVGAGKLTFFQSWRNVAPCSTNVVTESKVVNFNAISIKLTRQKKEISAKSRCEITDDESKSSITIATIPAGFESMVLLNINRVEPENEPPPGSGSLYKESGTKWIYQSFEEPQTELHPKDKTIFIGARIPSIGCTNESNLFVKSAFNYLTGPPVVDSNKKGTQFMRAYSFILCKYSSCLATAGGKFKSVTIVDTDYAFSGFRSADAWTDPFDNVMFGQVTFTDENHAASTIGHELRHTADPFYWRPEANAYTWEIDHAACTGINETEISRLKQKRDE